MLDAGAAVLAAGTGLPGTGVSADGLWWNAPTDPVAISYYQFPSWYEGTPPPLVSTEIYAEVYTLSVAADANVSVRVSASITVLPTESSSISGA